MFEIITDMFSYDFLIRAFIVGFLVSICASLLGTSLILKRYSMIGDGLSHVGFGSLAIGSAFNFAPLIISTPAMVLAAFVLLRIGTNSKLKGDALIALLSTSAMAFGVVVISLTKGLTLDVCNYMFGSILAMTQSDLYLSICLSIFIIISFVLFYNKFFAVVFDENFAHAAGIKTKKYNAVLAVLTAVTITLGMRMMGALLISSLIIFPSITAMRLCKTYKSVILCSVIISLICFFAGIVLSYLYEIPVGAAIVILNLIMFLIFMGIGRMRIVLLKRKVALLCLIFMILPSLSFGSEYLIRERFFLTQVDAIYRNPKSYLGRTIRLEGIMGVYGTGKDKIHYVYRYGPGCCAADGSVGFQIKWDKDYPPVDAWVEACGVLEQYRDKYNIQYLVLRLSEIKVMEKRGKEMVAR